MNLLSLDRLLFELNYPVEVEAAVRKKLDDSALMSTIAENAYDGEGFDFPLCKRKPPTRLAAVTLLLLQNYPLYRQLGASDQIIFDTFRDVSLRAGLYYNKMGKSGISKEDTVWFRHIMNQKLFKIGTLQFQPFQMIYLDKETIGEAYMEFSPEQKASLPNGTPVINCHIQKGADLSPVAVERSFQQATDFFHSAFPDTAFRAFLCYSWLLYPKMTESLAPQSHIRHFSECFTIIGSCSDREQAMENLFDRAKPEQTKPLTSLQKTALYYPEKFGFACGIRKIID